MRTLYIDAFSGISGNMFLGACLELGVPREHLEEAFAALGMPELHLHVDSRDSGNHLFATHVTVMAGDHPADPEDALPPTHGDHAHHHGDHHHHHHGDHHHHHHGDHHHHHGDHHHHHDHHHHGPHASHHGPHADATLAGSPPDASHGHGEHHHHHHHRAWLAIRDLIAGSALNDRVKRLSLAIFGRIAAAEARMHGTSEDEVHFHEVGALDSIADIVGAAAAIDWLGVEHVVCAPLPMGRGSAVTAHGRIPLPAPATALILEGAHVVGVERAFEFVTPTGAAIVMELASAFGPLPAMAIERIGHGAGSRRLPGHANLLRLFLGRAPRAHGLETRELVELAANIDDMNPEHFGPLRDRLLALDGVLDVTCSPLTMKDGRPAIALEVLCTPDAADRARHLVLTESTSLGVRSRTVRRDALARELVDVDTPYGIIPVKLGLLDGRIVNLAPEYRVARERALGHDVPLKQVYAEAIAAARAAGLALGAQRSGS